MREVRRKSFYSEAEEPFLTPRNRVQTRAFVADPPAVEEKADEPAVEPPKKGGK